jgi:hypothetical protein
MNNVQMIVHEGNRNETLFNLACGVRGLGCSQHVVHIAVFEANLRCTPQLSVEECNNIVKSAMAYEVV